MITASRYKSPSQMSINRISISGGRWSPRNTTRLNLTSVQRPLKRWYPNTLLHRVTSQKTTTWNFTVVKPQISRPVDVLSAILRILIHYIQFYFIQKSINFSPCSLRQWKGGILRSYWVGEYQLRENPNYVHRLWRLLKYNILITKHIKTYNALLKFRIMRTK